VIEWLTSLQARERAMVIVAAVFVVCAAFYAGSVQLDRKITRLGNDVAMLERALAELKPLKLAIQNSGGSTVPAAGNQSLVVVVDSTLRQRNLYSSLQRSQPTGDNAIRVEFENIAFDELIAWLGEINAAHGMQVSSGSFSVTTQNAAGRVNASLNLER